MCVSYSSNVICGNFDASHLWAPQYVRFTTDYLQGELDSSETFPVLQFGFWNKWSSFALLPPGLYGSYFKFKGTFVKQRLFNLQWGDVPIENQISYDKMEMESLDHMCKGDFFFLPQSFSFIFPLW